MNDQTSPTAGGQGPGSPRGRNPFHESQGAQGMPEVPRFGDDGPAKRFAPAAARLLRLARPDLLVFGILLLAGGGLGVAAGLLWYRFAPTVWLTIPADVVSQVKSNVDQSALLVVPEGKGIASVDGYYFVFTALAGLLLGVLGFWLGRRGLAAGADRAGQPAGAGVGAWAGVLCGGAVASTLAAALGNWVSLPDPLAVLHAIAAGRPFHAPVALHAQGLYLAAPVLGTVLFLALTAAFTKPSPPAEPANGQRSQMFFSSDNPYGFSEEVRRGDGYGVGAGPVQEKEPSPDTVPPENGETQSFEPGTPSPQADPFWN